MHGIQTRRGSVSFVSSNISSSGTFFSDVDLLFANVRRYSASAVPACSTSKLKWELGSDKRILAESNSRTSPLPRTFNWQIHSYIRKI